MHFFHFSVFIILLFVSVRAVVTQALLHYLFLLPERWCLKQQRGLTLSSYESLSAELSRVLYLASHFAALASGLRKNTVAASFLTLQLFIRFTCSWYWYQLPVFSPKSLNITGLWAKKHPLSILCFRNHTWTSLNHKIISIPDLYLMFTICQVLWKSLCYG